MTLRHEPDVSVAGWWAARDEPWVTLCQLGPSGYPAYARLPQSTEGDLDRPHLDRLVGILGRHTTTPGDCFFGLWDGFGQIHGGPAVVVMTLGGVGPPPVVGPAFPAEVLAGPRVRIPARDYLLFRGPLAEAGQWGAAELSPGHPRDINSPNVMWPADRAWFVATEIDVPWTGLGGSEALVAEILADPELEAHRTAWGEPG